MSEPSRQRARRRGESGFVVARLGLASSVAGPGGGQSGVTSAPSLGEASAVEGGCYI